MFPHKNMRCGYIRSFTSLSLFFPKRFSFRTRYKPNINIRRPCPKSPNMIANKKGKVMIVNGAVKTIRKSELINIKQIIRS